VAFNKSAVQRYWRHYGHEIFFEIHHSWTRVEL